MLKSTFFCTVRLCSGLEWLLSLLAQEGLVASKYNRYTVLQKRYNMRKQNNPKTNSSIVWRIILSVLFLVIAVYILIVHWHIVDLSFRQASHAQATWFFGALTAMILTTLIAAMIYGVLAVHRLRYAQTVLVEVAAGFVNRILPSGLGSLGLHGVYLYRRKHTGAEATAVVSVNNLLGIAAHILLLLALFIARPNVMQTLHITMHFAVAWPVLLITLGILCLLGIRVIRSRAIRFAKNLLISLGRVGPRRALKALGLALLLTTVYTVALFCSGRSIGIHLSVLQIFLVFTAGMFSGTVTPLPGGLVGAEAGLLAGFVAYGVSDAQAGAAVVIFRLVTYWLPIAPGVVALLLARRRNLV